MTALRFDHLREVNVARCIGGWRHALDLWDLDDWVIATGGEYGEAMNLAKKLNRARDGLIGNKDPVAVLKVKFGDELADAVIYLDLLAASEGLAPLGDVPSFQQLLDSNEFRPYASESASRHLNRAMQLFGKAVGNLEQAAWYAGRGDEAGTISHRETAADYLNGSLQRLAGAGARHGIDLGYAVLTKFNRTSEELGFTHRLRVTP